MRDDDASGATRPAHIISVDYPSYCPYGKKLLVLVALALALLFAGLRQRSPRSTLSPRSTARDQEGPFHHWLAVAAKQQAVRRPRGPRSRRTSRSASPRARGRRPAKGQPKPTPPSRSASASSSTTACSDQVMQFLIRIRSGSGEAESARSRSPTPRSRAARTTRRSSRSRRQADYQKFLKTSGDDEGRPARPREARQLLTDQMRRRSRGHRPRSAAAQITAYYNKNRPRFAQPERRDLRVVLTKDKARPSRPRPRSKSGTPGSRRQEVLDRPGLQGPGRQAAGVAKGQQEKALRHGDLQRQEGRARRPGQDAVRLLRLRGHRVTPASSRRWHRPTRRSTASPRRTSRRR